MEATECKDSVALSLLDDDSEIVVQDSFPKEVNVDVTVESDGIIEGTDDLKKAAISITTHG